MAGKYTLMVLGPQRLEPTVAEALAELEIDGKIALVTAGWQDRESEDEELSQAAGGRTVNLELYRRADEILAKDPALFEAHRRRQNELKEAQRLYRRRLFHALAAWSELVELDSGSELARSQRDDAMVAVRDLDRYHLATLQRVHRRFEREVRPARRRVIGRHRGEIRELLEDCRALAIAGGHVAILLNRLRLFGMLDLACDLPIIAWSAGAMALAERVVVFHDNPPQGAGNAEVLETGLGRISGLVPLPHARRRLRLGDARRVQRLAERFEPDCCIALDEGDRLAWSEEGWRALSPARCLMPTGEVETKEGLLGHGR